MNKLNLKQILWFLFSLYFAYMFVKNGWRKFDVEGFWGPAFGNWGYPVWFLYFIGVVEFAGGLLLVVPRYNVFGALALAVVMLGALITRIIHGVGMGDAFAISFYGVCMLLIAEKGGFFERFKKPEEIT